MTRIVRSVLLVAVLVLPAGCGSGDLSAADRAHGAWERLPAPPLGPRESPVALSLGGEALFVGGSDADPCAPSAGCATPAAAPLRDGAAFDSRARRWRRIAPAPVGLSFAQVAVLGGAAYLLVPGEPGRPGAPAAFLRYRRSADRWTRLPLPPDARRRGLVATGGQVVAYAESDEGGRIPDVVFTPARGTWTALPDDPLPPSFGRSMAWSAEQLVLLAQELVPQPGSREPALVIAAAFDPRRGTWRRLPDSEILGGGGRWFAHDGRLILPALGRADGGDGAWGRSYPDGGILDVERARWLALPDPPEGEDAFAAGVVAGRKADVFGDRGWIFDAVAQDWIAIPERERGGRVVSGTGVTAAGREVVVFGGARWGDDARGELLGEAWAWALP